MSFDISGLTGFVGDRQILFADKVLKFTGTGKMKRRILVITDYAVYIIDPETYILKRRITLAAVEKLYLSTLCDNFFVLGIPTEYDILMASTRKTEIVTVLVDATKNASNFELDVIFKNRCLSYLTYLRILLGKCEVPEVSSLDMSFKNPYWKTVSVWHLLECSDLN